MQKRRPHRPRALQKPVTTMSEASQNVRASFSCFIRGFRSNENAQGLVMLGNAFDRFGHGGLGLACLLQEKRSGQA